MTTKTGSTSTGTIGLKPVELAGIAAGMITVVIWGGYLASSRAGVTAGLSGMDVAFIRITVAALLFAPIALNLLLKKKTSFKWLHITVLTLLIGPPFVFISAGGYAYAPLAHGAILTPTFLTIGGLIFAKILLSDTISKQALIGVSIILTGLMLIAGSAFFEISVTFLIGDGMFIFAGLMWAMAVALQKKWNLQPIELAAFVSVLGALIYAPYYLTAHSLEPIKNLSTEMLWFMIIIQGVLSGVVALFSFAKAIQLLGAARASLFPALVPAVAILVGIPITGELPTTWQWAGLVIVTVGLITAVARSR